MRGKKKTTTNGQVGVQNRRTNVALFLFKMFIWMMKNLKFDYALENTFAETYRSALCLTPITHHKNEANCE